MKSKREREFELDQTLTYCSLCESYPHIEINKNTTIVKCSNYKCTKTKTHDKIVSNNDLDAMLNWNKQQYKSRGWIV